MDRIDRAIVGHLQKNARLSNKELAARVGLAPSSCLERTRRIEAEGWIQGYHAHVRPAALGIGLEALIAVRVERQGPEVIDAFRGAIREFSEVVGLYYIAGANDFLLHVAARDVAHIREIAQDRVTSLSVVTYVETVLIFEHERIRELPDLLATGD